MGKGEGGKNGGVRVDKKLLAIGNRGSINALPNLSNRRKEIIPARE